MMTNPKPQGLTREDVPPPRTHVFRTVWYVDPTRQIVSCSLITEQIQIEKNLTVPLQRYQTTVHDVVRDMSKSIPEQGMAFEDHFFVKHGLGYVDPKPGGCGC